MKELIAITTSGQGSLVVSARELHEFLGVKSRFIDWIKNRVGKYKFLEDTDYVTVSKNLETGGRELDYALTLDTAKQLAMVERTEKGRQARLYFIDCEKQLYRRVPVLPSSLLVDHAHRIADLEQQLKQMMDSQQQAARSLLGIPRSSEILPEETTRIKVQRLVNAYCRAKSVGQQEVWRKVYDRLYYLYKINIRAHKRSERESWLDVVDRMWSIEKATWTRCTLLPALS